MQGVEADQHGADQQRRLEADARVDRARDRRDVDDDQCGDDAVEPRRSRQAASNEQKCSVGDEQRPVERVLEQGWYEDVEVELGLAAGNDVAEPDKRESG
jgi:hypothetical protein